MMKHRSFFALLLTLTLLLSSCGPVNLMSQAGIRIGLPKSGGTFDYSGTDLFQLSLWQAVAENLTTEDNALISPLSAAVALSMAAEGASGDTRKAFEAVGLTEPEALGSLLAALTELDGTAFTSANSLWLNESNAHFTPLPTYLEAVGTKLGAEMFSTDAGSMVSRVNSWISDRTGKQIKKMLEELSPDTAMLLVNALTLKAFWKYDFEKSDSCQRTFFQWNGLFEAADYLYNGTRNEQVYENKDLIGVVMPYEDGRLAFTALMPTDRETTTAELTAMIGAEGKYSLKELVDGASAQYVDFYFPKLELKTDVSLAKPLCDMGLEVAFDHDRADFSAMGSTDGSIWVDNVLQSAVLKVDEEGTTAAAATVVVIAADGCAIEDTEPPRVIEFNRPFLYAVVDTDTGAILFCGQVNHLD